MFSSGQLTFGALFFITFCFGAVYVYRKDAKMHQTFYKGSYKVLIAFALFIAILFLIKVFLKR